MSNDGFNQNIEQSGPQVVQVVEGNKANPQLVSITEAAKINNVTRQAIYVAIKQKKLKAYKNGTRWCIPLKDLEIYRQQKYSRAKSMFAGELVFDNNKGFYSVNQVAQMLGVPAQKIYYATRIGLVKATRKGAAWVIHVDEIKKYKENYLDRRAQIEQAFFSAATAQ